MDTNRIIKIEELEVGDEILVPSNSHLRYFKVLRKPKMTSKATKYSKGVLVNKWSGTRCSMKLKDEEITRYSRRVQITTYFCTPEEHNCEKMIYGLDYRDIWLVKREGM